MMDLLRDPVWQFAGAVAAVFAIVISIAIYYAQRTRKNLSVEILQNGSILTITEESVGKLQLLFNGERVHNARLIEMRTSNPGNAPISPSDFIQPLTFRFNEDAVVLSAVIVAAQPAYLGPNVYFCENMINVEPLLLNPKDSFTLKFLISGYKSGPVPNARITGVAAITRARRRPYHVAGGLAASYFCSMIGLWLQRPSERPPLAQRIAEAPEAYVFIVVSALALIWAAVGLVKMLERK